MPFIFVIAPKARMHPRFGWQIRCRVRDRLYAGLLIVADNRHRITRRSLLEQFDLAIDAQHLGHLRRETWVTPLQVLAHLVWLHLFRLEDLADSPLSQFAQTGVAGRGPMSRACRANKRVVHTSCG